MDYKFLVKELSGSELKILLFLLSETIPVNITVLAKETNLSAKTVNNSINSLLKKELISVKEVTSNGRIFGVNIMKSNKKMQDALDLKNNGNYLANFFILEYGRALLSAGKEDKYNKEINVQFFRLQTSQTAKRLLRTYKNISIKDWEDEILIRVNEAYWHERTLTLKNVEHNFKKRFNQKEKTKGLFVDNA